VLDPGPSDLVLLLPLRVVVGRQVLASLVRAEGAHEHEAPRTRRLCRGDEVTRALLHDAADGVRLREGWKCDEMDDGFHAVGGAAEALRVRHVALDELAPPRPQPLVLLGTSGQRANRVLLGTECMDDVAADEPGAADDKNRHLEKFFQ
jgi:hypothetical protein